MLEIKDLHAGVDGNEIVNGVTLSINKGEIHAIMGPNGSGKSTLAKVLSGHPAYEITAGKITFENIQGEETAKRRAIISAAGAHDLIMLGPPGSGKTVLAKCIHSLLPDLTLTERNECGSIHAAAGQSFNTDASRPPWQSPHSSTTALPPHTPKQSLVSAVFSQSQLYSLIALPLQTPQISTIANPPHSPKQSRIQSLELSVSHTPHSSSKADPFGIPEQSAHDELSPPTTSHLSFSDKNKSSHEYKNNSDIIIILYENPIF